jgi:hypothetical protein
MTVRVEGYVHRPGEHCASTAMRNLLAFHGLEFSEPMVIGLGGGIGFYFLRGGGLSPSRIFHGRAATLEADFCRHTGIAFLEHMGPDDELAWTELRKRLDAGIPVSISVDTFYLPYHRTTSHFPGHRVVVVGYDAARRCVWLADRKFEADQECAFEALRSARNSPDYPWTCLNGWAEFPGEVRCAVPPAAALRAALRTTADRMLSPPAGLEAGLPAMRALAAELPRWGELEDWSWASRFGYQVIVKRGSGGSFFRSLYADFLEESATEIPAVGRAGLSRAMAAIAARWRELAGVLQAQSERDVCDPSLFARAGAAMSAIADAEEAFFRCVRDLVATEPGEASVEA